jgi:MoaA/NifB/PqqE/SkfB family radical SAM enzyme
MPQQPYTSPDLLSGTDAPLCVLPWIHAHIGTSGDVNLCCVSSGSAGNIRQKPIAELFASDLFRTAREQMLEGKWPAACRQCQQREAMKLRSFRQSNNEIFATHYRQLRSGASPLEARILSVDLRLNNVCNFKCRSCSGTDSNRWFQEHNIIYPNNPLDKSFQSFEDVPAFWEDFERDILPCLEEIHFAGGEPLLNQRHYLILENLLRSGQTGVRLFYNTNLSQLRFMHWDVVELWRNFTNLSISLSLDGVGQQGEYIRDGLNYNVWCENARRIRSELPSAVLSLHFVVSIFNILHLPHHCRTILETGIVPQDCITFTFLEWPPYLNVQVLPPALKAQVASELRAWLDQTPELGPGIRSQLDALIGFLRRKDLFPQLGESFLQKTRTLDRLRGQDAFALFPELRAMVREGA